jgi:ribosomal protein S18 acetylase RimI-like enzyme
MTETEVPKYAFRKANGDDHTDILAVLEEVASEVPVKLDSSAHQDAIKGIIVACCGSGESLVAVDDSGTVVGFVLVKPDIFADDESTLSLRYAGVSKGARRRGILSALMQELMAKGVPLTATVLNNNQSAMADRLIKAGYQKVGSNDKEANYRWSPAPPTVKA